MNTNEQITGEIERIVFHSAETGFCVLRVKVRRQRDLVTVTGAAACITAGEHIECSGVWKNHSSYGLQFVASQIDLIKPNTLSGMEKYLGSGLIRGIGPHFAKKLVAAFKEQVFDIIENDVEQLLILPGIGKVRVQNVKQSWDEQKVIRKIMVFLQSHGVGTSLAVRIYKTYLDKSIEIVTENPYRLSMDIRGIGFKTADKIAQNLGIAKDSLIRAAAGLNHVLQIMCDDGHTTVVLEDLLAKSQKLLEIPENILTTAVKAELSEKNIIKIEKDEQIFISLSGLYKAEKNAAAKILQLLACDKLPWGVINFKNNLENNSIKLSEKQQQAVYSVLSHKISILTGGPGVGKTTIVKTILAYLSHLDIIIRLAAPTGRAAKRLQETTGIEAKTIHRLLELDPKTFAFKYNENNLLAVDFLVIDEASMIDIVLLNKLLKAIPKTSGILIVGDIDQLPSVGPGAVLRDLINSQVINTIKLTEIFRQAQSSKIITNAHLINHGQMPSKNDQQNISDFYTIYADEAEQIAPKLLALINQRIPRKFNYDPIKEIQVLTPMNKGSIGVRSLNIELQKVLNKNFATTNKITRYGTTYAEQDKVIQMINNYEKEVFNGDIGFIEKIDQEENLVIINFDNKLVEYDASDLDELNLAYACSIHKSQGSEYPVVIIPLAMQHYTLLARNLLYTAVTRGKKLVIIIAEKKALFMAVKNFASNDRLTHLKDLIQKDAPSNNASN